MYNHVEHTELSKLFTHVFSSLSPLSWEIREENPENWVRLYSLPGGKRYPTNRLDRDEIFRRYNEISRFVFGGSPSKVYVYSPLERDSRFDKKYLFKCGDWSMINENSEFKIFGKIWKSYEEVSSKFLRFIAYDKIMPSIIINDNGQIIAPYDGGFDLFLKDPSTRGDAEAEFFEWVSKRNDGL